MVFNILFALFLVALPLGVLLSPFYWSLVFQAPLFHLVSLAFFITALTAVFSTLRFKHPLFLLPFTCSFLLTTWSQTYHFFIQNYCIFFALIATTFALYRTREPLQLLMIRLFATNYFTDYFEVYTYWRTVVLIICPIFIPLLWIVSMYFCW